MFPWITRALAAVTMLACAAGAEAAQVTYDAYWVRDNQNVLVRDDKAGFSEWVGSGQINITGTNTPGGTLALWCVDIPEMLRSAGQFVSTYTLTGPIADQINALLTYGVPRITPDDHDVSSALQLAVWKTVYGDDLTIGPSGRNVDLAYEYLDDVKRGDWRPNTQMQVTILSGGGFNQDQAYLTMVPEPGSLVLFGTGLLTLALARRMGPLVGRTS